VHRMLAIIERDLRRFKANPALVVMSLTIPLLQLVILGYAFGGQIKHLEVGVVDHDGHVPAANLTAMFNAVAANARTYDTRAYSDEGAAMADLRDGRLNGVVSIPPTFSRDLLAGNNPTIALISDNTDQFSSSALAASLSQMLGAYDASGVPPRATANVSLSVVEVYPYVPYIQYLLSGTIVLAIFLSAMMGGGIMFIEDKARGLHEGYLVTPITKLELIMGFNLSGTIKACIAGVLLVTVGSVIAGIPNPLDIVRLANMFVLVVLTAVSLISMMFLIMVRIDDPIVPRMIFGLLNTVLYFPSGAVYPTNAFPEWMRVLSLFDPFTYAVHGFKTLVLKNTGLAAIGTDIAFLAIFTVVAMAAATALFKRTL
jgi:ABC-type multidrug transport system permease subunit